MIRVDVQRELRLNGCAIEETKRMAKRREQHIKDLIARIEASHEQKKKRNIGLSNLACAPETCTLILAVSFGTTG